MKGLAKLLLAAGAWGILMAGTAYGGQWQQGSGGWQWAEDDGSLARSGWKWLDGDQDGVSECYYFDSAGNLAVNTWVDGSQVDGNGCWVVNGVVQTRTAELVEEAKAKAKLQAAMRMPAPNDLDLALSGNAQITAGDGMVQVNIGISGVIQFKNLYSAGPEALMDIRTSYNGQETIEQTFLKDGWLYKNADGEKLKLPVGDGNTAAGTVGDFAPLALSEEEIETIENVSMKDNGNGTFTIYYTYQPNGQGIFGELATMTGPNGEAMTLEAYKGEALIGPDGSLLQQKILLEKNGTSDGLPYGIHVYMETTVRNPGQPVQIQYPSTEGYMTIGQYLDQLLADAN